MPRTDRAWFRNDDPDPEWSFIGMAFAFYHDQSISSSEDYFECEGLIGALCNSLQEAAALAGRQIC